MGKSVMAFICDRITMGKIINIISHNVKPAAHKSFYNLATMAVKGNTDNKFIFLPSTIVQQDKNQNLVLVLSFYFNKTITKFFLLQSSEIDIPNGKFTIPTQAGVLP